MCEPPKPPANSKPGARCVCFYVVNDKSGWAPGRGRYGEFTDFIERDVVRVVHRMSGWEWVWYKGHRHQLLGGIRTMFNINLDRPIKGRRTTK